MRCNYQRFDVTKRLLDLGVSAATLVITSPIQLAVGAVVRVVHGRPVFFRQLRPGKNGEVFELVKFRTMRSPDHNYVTDADRLTPLGRFLRSTSLDELPTLWNVFKGDMSLVGPRPLLVSYLDHYTNEQMRRHEVRPGVTGLAQIRGRNATSWEDRLRHDVEYVDNRSLALDFKILLATVRSVLIREGINQVGHVTMPAFTDSDTEEGR